MAARQGHLDIVTMLLDRGAIIDEVVPGDENALISASGEGDLDVVRLLVGRGANVNARVWAEQGWPDRQRRVANPAEHGAQRRPHSGRQVSAVGRRGRVDRCPRGELDAPTLPRPTRLTGGVTSCRCSRIFARTCGTPRAH